MSDPILPILELNHLSKERPSVISTDILKEVELILEQVRALGEEAIRNYAIRFNELDSEQSLYITRDELKIHLESLDPDDRERLERIGRRIREFAQAQRNSIIPLDIDVPDGTMGHRIDPVHSAGCYAPGGRYPLPSSVLMTAVTARVAGVDSVWVASPRPTPITLAAAAVADVDGLLAVGGAHAIAGLAWGVGPVPPSDVVVGPGNIYVTTAKKLIAGTVAIDMLAGPSELVVIADKSANPVWIAADLLAQAEHDPEAMPILIATDADLIPAVETELRNQLVNLSTADTAQVALSKGGVILCPNLLEAARVSNAIAPEHLQLSVSDVSDLVPYLKHYGALFIGENSAEVFGDYGIGPNHVLPTSGTAKARGGLSVMDFLRVRTWIHLDGPILYRELVEDSAWLARQEGLEAHARAAELR